MRSQRNCLAFLLFYLISLYDRTLAFRPYTHYVHSANPHRDDVHSCRSIFNRPATCIPLTDCEPLKKLANIYPTIGRRVIVNSICSIHRLRVIVCCPQVNVSTSKNDGDTIKEKEPTSGRPILKPLYPPRCGANNPAQNRVVGGTPALPGAWPWIVRIGYSSPYTKSIEFRCAGSLITTRHVVTAGHCVRDLDNVRLARLGEYDLTIKDDNNTSDVRIEKIVLHPDFNDDTLENDIAVLRLGREVRFTDMIRPICLPLSESMRNRNLVRNYPFVAGWGSTSFLGSNSDKLLEAQIPVIENDECKRSYLRKRNIIIDHRVLCAGYPHGGTDACQGDSGGPLMLPQKKSFYLIGIVSGGYRCAEPGFPGIYTRVTSFLNFILTNLN